MPEEESLAKLLADPENLASLTPRQFEQTVAEILAAQGWRMNLTSGSRDGGYDLLAVSDGPLGLRSTWVIECKHYGLGRRVGLGEVHHLYALKSQLGVSNALLVTTSAFTKAARMFSGSRQDVQLADGKTLEQWLKGYRPAEDSRAHLPSRLFQSCFLSHSHKDQDFADFLAKRLQGEGVEVWYSPEHIQAGSKVHEQIHRAIRTFDRVLVILSENSMESEWVKSELRMARKRELDERRRVLFPVGLVPFEMIRSWECFDGDSGKDLATEVREFFIPYFADWREPGQFERAFRKLLEGLSVEE